MIFPASHEKLNPNFNVERAITDVSDKTLLRVFASLCEATFRHSDFSLSGRNQNSQTKHKSLLCVSLRLGGFA